MSSQQFFHGRDGQRYNGKSSCKIIALFNNAKDRINRLILFKNLFFVELEKNKEKTAEELNAIFQSKFPQDMVQDETTMSLLTSLSLRIERITLALPKWKHVADFTVNLLNQFFAMEFPDDLPSTNEAKLKYRREQLDKIVYQLPKNQEMRSNFRFILVCCTNA